LIEFIYHETGMRVKIDLEVLVPTYTGKAPETDTVSTDRAKCCIILPPETDSIASQSELVLDADFLSSMVDYAEVTDVSVMITDIPVTVETNDDI